MLELHTNFLLYCHLDMLADTFTVYISYPQNAFVAAVCCNFAPVKELGRVATFISVAILSVREDYLMFNYAHVWFYTDI